MVKPKLSKKYLYCKLQIKMVVSMLKAATTDFVRVDIDNTGAIRAYRGWWC